MRLFRPTPRVPESLIQRIDWKCSTASSADGTVVRVDKLVYESFSVNLFVQLCVGHTSEELQKVMLDMFKNGQVTCWF